MGNFIDEKALIKNVVNLHESVLETQYSRFLQQSPTFTTYYRVSNIESTTDVGYLNVERTLGADSPIKYNKIEEFPLYGVEEMVFTLDQDEEGLDMNYESSAIILANTIIPNPSDHFYFNHHGKGYVFQVVNITLDTVRSNPYYKIDYKLRAVDNGETVKDLEKQTVDTFHCEYTNIGTEDKVIVRSADKALLDRLSVIRGRIAEYYKMAFYDKRYNSFLFNQDRHNRLYDRTLTEFITRTSLFNKKGSYDTIFLTNEASSAVSQLEYHNSIFRALEQNDVSLIKYNKYHLMYVGDVASVFVMWQDPSIKIIEQGTKVGNKYYIEPELLDFFVNAKDTFANDDSEDKKEEVVEKSIIIPDKDMKPVYIPEADITNKFTPEMTIEEAASIPRGDCRHTVRDDKGNVVTDEGTLNFDSLFGSGSDDSDVLLFGSDNYEEEVIEKEEPLQPPTQIDISVEEEVEVSPIVVEAQTSKPTNEVIVELNVPTYLTDTKVQQYNTMVITIGKYFGGALNSVRDLDLDALEDYLDYVDINSRESFVLTPMLLFVLDSFSKQS